MVYISEDVLVASVFAFALPLPPVSSIGCCGLGRWWYFFRWTVMNFMLGLQIQNGCGNLP